MRCWKPCLATVLIAAALAACGTAAPPSAPVPIEPVCPEGLVTPDIGSVEVHGRPIPDGFVTAWVLRCRGEVRDRPGEGRWLVAVSERADTAAPELVAELRKPSDPRTTEACTLELVTQPYFLLVDANGEKVLPAVPTDGCGKPRREALAQLEKLTFRTVSERPVKQVEGPKPTETACADSVKDENIGPNRVELKVPEQTLPPGPLKICVYDRVSGDVGKLSKGRTIRGAAATLTTELSKLGPARVCSEQHARFAVLISDLPTGLPPNWGYAELDGCRRLILPNLVLRQLDERTVAMLAG